MKRFHKNIILHFILLVGCCSISAQERIITTLAGNGKAGYGGDGGQAIHATLNRPYAIALDSSGNIYVADCYNSRVRKVIKSTGVIITIAGTGAAGYNGDSIPATDAKLNYPAGVAIDAKGNVYIGDQINNRIRKVDAVSGLIFTIAGNGIPGYIGNGGPADSAELYYPCLLFLDSLGNVYINDALNNVEREVNSSTGIISTVIGSGYDAGTGYGAYSGDNGPATDAELNIPGGVAFDKYYNIYIADYGNQRIRKVNKLSDTISTVAGNGVAGYSGDGWYANVSSLSGPNDIKFDSAQNYYIADYGNNRIRRVDTSGIITTVAGNGVAGYSGDGGFATAAELNSPTSIAIDKQGNIYVADYQNNVIRKLTLSLAAINELSDTKTFQIYPNPTINNIKIITHNINLISATIKITDVLGRSVFQEPLNNLESQNASSEIDITNLCEGIYFVNLQTSDRQLTCKFIKIE